MPICLTFQYLATIELNRLFVKVPMPHSLGGYVPIKASFITFRFYLSVYNVTFKIEINPLLNSQILNIRDIIV